MSQWSLGSNDTHESPGTTPRTAPDLYRSYLIGLQALGQSFAPGYESAGIDTSGIGGPVIRFGGLSYNLLDGHGSVQMLLSAQGVPLKLPVFKYDDATGKLLKEPNYFRYLDTTITPLGFAGEYRDARTGLIYLRDRWMNPATGRFTQADRFRRGAGADLLGMNLYSYANGDGVNGRDPSGYFNIIELLAATSEGENLEAEQNLVAIQARNKFLKTKVFDVYFGITLGTASGGTAVGGYGLFPHLFLYVENTFTHKGIRYDINSLGLYLRPDNLPAVRSTTAFGSALWSIASFTVTQNIEWNASAYILAYAVENEREFGIVLPGTWIPATFSYWFVTGVNCAKWTFLAGASAVIISKTGK